MKKTSMGLDENIAGLLCYVLGWISGFAFLLLEKDNKFVRFHAIQSCIVFGIATVLLILFNLTVWVLGIIIWILTVLIWIFLMVKAYQGERYKLKWVGEYTDSAQALRSLNELKNEGVLTDEEYQRKKNQVLEEISSAESGTEPDEKIRQLDELRNEGILTDEEYERNRSQIERDAVIAEKIKKLDELRNEGILTDEEYEQKKNQILQSSG
jgi:uncharacterized membrane protein